jgi:hypothetical protein
VELGLVEILAPAKILVPADLSVSRMKLEEITKLALVCSTIPAALSGSSMKLEA